MKKEIKTNKLVVIAGTEAGKFYQVCLTKDEAMGVMDAIYSWHLGKIKCFPEELPLIEKKNAAVQLGKLGGQVKSEAKTRTAQANGKKGGRPRKCDCECHKSESSEKCNICTG